MNCVDGCRTYQVIWNIVIFICSICHQICFERHVKWYPKCSKASSCEDRRLPEFEPLKNPCVFVYNLSVFEVDAFMGFCAWHLDKGLIEIGWMEDIVFKFQETVHRSTQEFRVSQSISNILIFIFGFDFNIVFVSFGGECFGGRPISPFVFPFLNMLEVDSRVVEGSVSDVGIFICECVNCIL